MVEVTQVIITPNDIISLLGGVEEVKKAVKLAKIMRTMSIYYEDSHGVQGHFWIEQVDGALSLNEKALYE